MSRPRPIFLGGERGGKLLPDRVTVFFLPHRLSSGNLSVDCNCCTKSDKPCLRWTRSQIQNGSHPDTRPPQVARYDYCIIPRCPRTQIISPKSISGQVHTVIMVRIAPFCLPFFSSGSFARLIARRLCETPDRLYHAILAVILLTRFADMRPILHAYRIHHPPFPASLPTRSRNPHHQQSPLALALNVTLLYLEQKPITNLVPRPRRPTRLHARNIPQPSLDPLPPPHPP